MNANVASNHSICWNCEESVHRYATRCPYCSKDLANHAAVDQLSGLPNMSKIAPIHSFEEPEAIQDERVAEDSSFTSQASHILLSLFSLLAGSFFFFFGLLVLLFSQNGTFQLEWKASSWPFFVGSALTMLVVGIWSLSKIDK